VIEVLLYVSQDDFEETNVCNEIKRESPKQIHGIDNEDCPSFLGNETGALTEKAADGK
jgi:hypothetical protein